MEIERLLFISCKEFEDLNEHLLDLREKLQMNFSFLEHLNGIILND